MNRITKLAKTVAIVLLGTAFCVTSAIAQDHSNKSASQFSIGWGSNTVSLGSLYGWYGLLVSGPSSTPGAGGKYLTGALYFDGRGNVAGYDVNGGVNGQVGSTSLTGTYVANTSGSLAGTLTLRLNSRTRRLSRPMLFPSGRRHSKRSASRPTALRSQ